MHHATFAPPDLTVFCHLDELGLVATGQLFEPDRAVIECRVAEPDPWCRGCGSQALSRGTDTRRLAHEPFGHRPTTLLVRVRRYKCSGCGRSWREDLTAAAPERAKLSRSGMRWALEALVIDHLTVARVAAGLGVGWHTANNAVLAEGRRVLIDDPARFDGVAMIGVDEHVWRHTRVGDKYVTVIIDLTPNRDKTGPARLLDMIEGHSKAVFKTWLAARPQDWRDGVEGVAGDLNDEPQAATTQILLGPGGSEFGTAGYEREDQGDATRMWNLAPLIAEEERFTRVYRGRGELIDHLMVSHALTEAVESVTTGSENLSSVTDSPGHRDNAEASDHRPVIATFHLS